MNEVNKILDNIYNRIFAHEISDIHMGLKGGYAGLFVFYSLYSEVKEDTKARDKAQNILEICLSYNLENKPCTLWTGYLGLVWSIQYMEQVGILESDSFLHKIYKTCNNACFFYFSSFPVKYDFNDDMFSMGLYFLKLIYQTDTIQFYYHTEQVLKLIENCDQFLNKSIEGIYIPENMSLRLFHSIYYFLLETHKRRIYPVKTRQLLYLADQLYPNLKNKDPFDSFIVDILRNNEINLSDLNWDLTRKINFLSEMGYYSVLYSNQNIFIKAIHLLEKEDTHIIRSIYNETCNRIDDLSLLCGIGLGLVYLNYLQYEKNINS